MTDNHAYDALDLQCQHFDYTLDKIKKKAKKLFGEGFTWTCPNCFKQYVLTQGKGDYWYWQEIS